MRVPIHDHFFAAIRVFALVVFFGCAPFSKAAFFHKTPPAKPAVEPIEFEHEIKPLLAKYCYSCHGDKKQKADLSLEAFADLSAILKEKPVWQRVLHNVQTGDMPPENKPQPSEAERKLIVKWLEADVFGCDCDNPDPGRVTLHRLNRAEYNNTIRDLLGVDFRAADDFPRDDSGYGFDNIGDVLSLPPILLEKYMAAAEKILDQAIVTDFSTNGTTAHFDAAKIHFSDARPTLRDSFVQLSHASEVSTPFNFQRGGDFIFRIRAAAGNVGTEPAKLAFKINDEIIQSREVSASLKSPELFEIHFKTGPGTKKIAAAFFPEPDDKSSTNAARRHLFLDYLEIVGPIGPIVLPETHKRIFTKAVPQKLEERKTYAREIVDHFAERAYRRPISATELDRLMRFVEAAQNDGETFEGSVKLAFQAILVSPKFLFRGELQPNSAPSKSIHEIDEFTLASRLSYFLWSSMPDDELMRLAKRGALRKNLKSQVRRMLADKKSSALVENFAGQWLQLRNLNLVMPDVETFPEFDDSLRAAMRKETELFFQSMLKENRSVFDFLNADYTFLNERLARHYGISGVNGENFRRVSLKGTERRGILTQGSILTLTSNPTRTSPVKRGKWVLDNILGSPPPPPPPNVPELKDGTNSALNGTIRERLEEHRENPNCASCHSRMDPIGFAFENFDAVGKWRTRDGKLPIDASGELVSGESFRDSLELRQILATRRKDEFVRCLSEKLLTYALGRGMELYDRCAIDDISKRAAKDHYKFDDLIFEIVKSVPFQFQRGEAHLAQTH